MLSVILAASILAAPCKPVLKNDTAAKLARVIVKTNPRAQPYALRLARAIVREAKRVSRDWGSPPASRGLTIGFCRAAQYGEPCSFM